MSATVATGTAAAAAAMNPWAQVGGMFAMGLGQGVLGGGGQPGVLTGTNESPMDSSGWNVNFGAGRIDSQYDKKESSGAAAALDGYLPYAVLFVGALIAWRLSRK